MFCNIEFDFLRYYSKTGGSGVVDIQIIVTDFVEKL